MVQSRNVLPVLTLTVSAALMLAGCPEDTPMGLAAPPVEPENDVFQVLGETLTAAVKEPSTFDGVLPAHSPFT